MLSGEMTKKSNELTELGFNFLFDPEACESCSGKCCRKESGYVWVKKADILRIASYTGLESGIIINDYLVKIGKRYSIKEVDFEGEFPCVFFDMSAHKCLIYPVRPAQCRSFPFWEEYKDDDGSELVNECPGVVKQNNGIKVKK